MAWWIVRPNWEAGERTLWSCIANREQDGGRQVGGRLYLTNCRFYFQPHRIDARTGGEVWSTPLSELQEVREVPRDFVVDGRESPAQLRRRLLIESSNAGQSIFVVNRVTRKVAMIQKLIHAL